VLPSCASNNLLVSFHSDCVGEWTWDIGCATLKVFWQAGSLHYVSVVVERAFQPTRRARGASVTYLV